MRTASAKESVPAATCAEYSPRLWPATNAGAHAARLEQAAGRDADGEDRRLRVLGEHQPVAGPSKHSALSDSPSAASASSNVVAADRETASASAWPMPTFCAPCPGKMNAIMLDVHLTSTRGDDLVLDSRSIEIARSTNRAAMRDGVAHRLGRRAAVADDAEAVTPSSGAPPYSE